MTTLCRFNQHNPLPSSFSDSYAELAASGFIEKNSPHLNPLDYHIWKAMMKATINSSRSLRRLMSCKVACWLSGNSCHKNTSTRRCMRLYKALDCPRGC